MRVPAERRAARGDLLLFGGCVVLALLSLALPTNWASGVTTALRGTVLRPIVLLQSRATADRTARFQLHHIEAVRDSLGQVAQNAGLLFQENANLRQLLELGPRLSLPYVSAEVLHQGVNTDSRMLLINVGTAEGVAPFDPVVTADGLLGEIWQAEAHSSSVLTWLHPEFRAHVVTANQSVQGIVAPTQSATSQTALELTGIALRDTLDLGTSVYTSSLGGVYPRGIPVGRVISIGRDSLSYERVYRVAPFANPGATTHALVLKAAHGTVFLPLPQPDTTRKP